MAASSFAPPLARRAKASSKAAAPSAQHVVRRAPAKGELAQRSTEEDAFEPDWSEPEFDADWSRSAAAPPTEGPAEGSARVQAARLRSARIQAALTVSQPGDELEQEAERVAEHVLRAPAREAATEAPAPASPSAVMRAPAGNVQAEAEEDVVDEEEEDAALDETMMLQRACAACEGEEDDDLLPAAAPAAMPLMRAAEPLWTEGPVSEELQRACAACEAKRQEEEDEEEALFTGGMMGPSDVPVMREADLLFTPGETSEDETSEEVQRACSSCRGEEDEARLAMQRALDDEPERSGEREPAFEEELRRARAAGGEPLPEPVRTFMEQRFGASFEGVRVHKDRVADSLARDVHARAFTIGRDLFFKQGQFQPSSEQGKHLIAHELTHVLQQQAGMKSVQRDVIQREADTEQGEAAQCETDAELPSVSELLDLLQMRRDLVPKLVLDRLERILGTALAHPEADQVFDVLDPRTYPGEGSRKRRELIFGPDRFAVAGTWNAGQPALDLSWELEQPGFHSGGFEGTVSVPIEHSGTVDRANTELDNKSLTLVQDPLDLAEPLPLDEADVEPETDAGPEFSALEHAELHGATPREAEPVELSADPVQPAFTIEPEAIEREAIETTQTERTATQRTATQPTPNQPTPSTAATPAAATTTGAVPQGGGIAGFDPGEIALAAGGGGGGTEPLPAAEIDASDSSALLTSVAGNPPSAFADAVTQGTAAVGDIQAKEQADLEAGLPEMPAPRGLEARERRDVAPTVLEPGEVPGEPVPGSREGDPYETNHDPGQGPLPASGVSTQTRARDPQTEEDSSWFSWLTDRVASFLSAIPTSDPNVETSAGARPTVDATGDADPGLMTQQQEAADEQVAEKREAADAATTQDFGENDIFPSVDDRELRPETQLSAPPSVEAGAAPEPISLEPAHREQVDAQTSGWLDEQLEPRLAENAEQVQQRDEQSAQEKERTALAIEEEESRTREAQEDEQAKAQGGVEGERQAWREQNRAAGETYDKKTAEGREAAIVQIDDRIATANQEADAKLSEGESKAETKKADTERQAESKVQEAKGRSKSFWESVSDGVASVFASIKNAINTLFNELRKAVKAIIEEAKRAAAAVIEAGRSFVVNAIRGFGALVKGALSIALIAFPDLAKKARATIDVLVEGAVKVVNVLADGLTQAVSALLDGLGAVLDGILAAYQTFYVGLFSALEAVAQILVKAMKAVADLVESAKLVPSKMPGALLEALVGVDFTKPLPFERTAPAELPAAAEQGAEPMVEGGSEAAPLEPLDTALLEKTEFTADDIVVENPPAFELTPELLAELPDEGEPPVEFAASNDPERSVSALLSEATGEEELAAAAPSADAEEGAPAPAGPDIMPGGPPAALAPGVATETGPEGETAEQALARIEQASAAVGCETKEPQGGDQELAETEKIVPPLTAGQRAGFLGRQLWNGVKTWVSCHIVEIVAVLVGAIVAIVAAEIITGGAISALIPVLLPLVEPVLIAVGLGLMIVDIVKGLTEFFVQGLAGNKDAAATGLARALGAALAELVNVLVFNALTVAARSIKAAVKATGRAIKSGVKATGRAVGRVADAAGARLSRTAVGRGARRVGQGLGAAARATRGAALRGGKLVMNGGGGAIGRGARRLRELGDELLGRFRFKKFRVRSEGKFLVFEGFLNPWVPLGRVLKKLGNFDEAIQKVGKGFGRSPAESEVLIRNAHLLPEAEQKSLQRLIDKVAEGQALTEADLKRADRLFEKVTKSRGSRRLRFDPLDDTTRLKAETPEHMRQRWFEWQRRHRKPEQFTEDIDPAWAAQYQRAHANRGAGSVAERKGLDVAGVEKNNGQELTSPSGVKVEPDGVVGLKAGDKLVSGQPYDLVEVKNVATLANTGNVKEMIMYVSEYGGSLTLVVRENTRLTRPLADALSDIGANVIDFAGKSLNPMKLVRP